MRILVMGGTLFAGRAIVEAAVHAGHDVTLFNRGQTNPNLRQDVENLFGDRNVDLSALRGRSFDEVVDTSAYYPRQIHSVVDALDCQIGHYTFISSLSVYAKHNEPGADESAELSQIVDNENESSSRNYGGYKALCERALDERLPGRIHHVRAGIIVGPFDNTGRFSYWVQRFCQGGQILVPEPREQAVQYIDVRDLANWVVSGAEKSVTGAYNVTSAVGETLESMMDNICSAVQCTDQPVWVAEDLLVRNKVVPFSELPMWLPPVELPQHFGFFLRDTSKAMKAGLMIRPRAETIIAIKSWLDAGHDLQTEKNFGNANHPVGLTRQRELELIRESLGN